MKSWRSVLAACLLATLVLPVGAETLDVLNGRGAEVCDAYKHHLDRYAALPRVLACGERFFDSSTVGIAAPSWRPLEPKKNLALYENVQAYEIALRAAAQSWPKEEIDRYTRLAKRAVTSGDVSMWLAAVDLGSDGSTKHVLVVQQGTCARLEDLPADIEKAYRAEGRRLGIDLAQRLKQRPTGGTMYLLNETLTDVDRGNHERFFGPGGGAFGLFLFKGKAYIDAFNAQRKSDFFGKGTFTVMDTLGVGRPSVCEVAINPEGRDNK